MPNNLSYRPIVYVRGFAGIQSDVESTVDDPFYGFNLGSTHYRINQDGAARFFAFESPLLRLSTDHGYSDAFAGSDQTSRDLQNPQRSVWIFRFYDPTSRTFDDQAGGRRLSIEEAAA